MWGTFGKNGDQPCKFVLIKDLETEHIEAILRTQKHFSEEYKKILVNELAFRKSI